jgi:ketosteroid isomerase-like protein
MRESQGKWRLRALLAVLICGCVFFVGATPAAAQKDKKKKKDDAAAQTPSPTPVGSDEVQINIVISEMLGAWQIGDVERLHKAYADDVSVVSGAWAPPVMGWANFLTEYQRQRARMQQVRMDRENTLVRVNGNFGWACYQWDFSGVVDGQQMAARGQSSLILEKRAGRWTIVHNHTSLLQSAAQPVQAAAPVTPPKS